MTCWLLAAGIYKLIKYKCSEIECFPFTRRTEWVFHVVDFIHPTWIWRSGVFRRRAIFLMTMRNAQVCDTRCHSNISTVLFYRKYNNTVRELVVCRMNDEPEGLRLSLEILFSFAFFAAPLDSIPDEYPFVLNVTYMSSNTVITCQSSFFRVDFVLWTVYVVNKTIHGNAILLLLLLSKVLAGNDLECWINIITHDETTSIIWIRIVKK